MRSSLMCWLRCAAKFPPIRTVQNAEEEPRGEFFDREGEDCAFQVECKWLTEGRVDVQVVLKRQYPDTDSNDPKVQKTTLGTTSRLQEIAKVPQVASHQ